MRDWRAVCCVSAALGLGAAGQARAELKLDGVLDEPEWSQAQSIEGFVTMEPYTLAPPEADLATDVKVFTDEDGIHVGVTCHQGPAVERLRVRGQRDQVVAGDRINLLIDFEASGNTAYELTAYLSGEQQDAIVSRQVESNYDWDGNWRFAAAETADAWTVEYFIPWGVAPMARAIDGTQPMGLFVSRVIPALARRYSAPGYQFQRPTFVQDLPRYRIRSFSHRQFDLYPYAAATRDFVAHDNDARVGLDLFWKSGRGRQQVTATVNPDFGQVESDQIVVNFSAIPTFFPDKRPFFTENQGLFETDNRVLYTRRIGAAPDGGDGSEGAADIIGAAKYTGGSGIFEYGAIAAFEDDTGSLQGRDFYVGRVRADLTPDIGIGWMGTHVERPEIDRKATVNAIDAQWRIAPGIGLRAQGLLSDVERPGSRPSTPLDPSGKDSAASLLFSYAPGGRFEQVLLLEHLGRRFQIDDAGFIERNNINRIKSTSAVYFRNYGPGDAVQERSAEVVLAAGQNDQGRTVQPNITFDVETVRNDTRKYDVGVAILDFGGADDLVTRGNGPVKFPVQHEAFAHYTSSTTGFVRYELMVDAITGLYRGVGGEIDFMPEFRFTDHFSVPMQISYTRAPDFMIWQGDGNLLATFRYQELFVLTGIDWFPTPRQELRALAQWSVGKGDVRSGYRPDPDGDLHRTGDPVQSFSFADTPLQLRYRFSIGPTSDLFVVYSRGGTVDRADDERRLGRLLRDGLRDEATSQFLVKVRYRFSP